jgi:hypothetical protein
MEKTIYNKQYYLKNRDKWDQYVTRINCSVCDKVIKKDHYNSHHVKTKKHIRLAAAKTEEQNKMELIRSAIRLELMTEMGQH